MIIQFICNLLTSSNNHLLLQLYRWLALVLEQAAAKRAMTVTYHHRHHHLLMSSLPNSWEARGLWRKPYASLRRTWLAPANSNRGLSQTSTASSRIFLDTKPPIFKVAEEPLQADEWLNTIEQKFHLLRVTEHQKAEYASHQLQGSAKIWWTH